MDQGTMVSRMLISVADSSGCPHSVCYCLYSSFFFNNGSVLWRVMCPTENYISQPLSQIESTIRC